MFLSVKKQAISGFLVGLFLLGLISVLFYRSTQGLLEVSRLSEESNRILEMLQEILSGLRDAETGQRGYVITGNTTYLAPYVAGARNARATLRTLTPLLDKNPVQRQRLSRLHDMSEAKLAEMGKTIELRTQSGFDAAAQEVRTDRGKLLMDEIRKMMRMLKASETIRFQRRQREVNQSAQSASWIALIFGPVAIGLFSLAYFRLNREMTERQRANEALRLQSKERLEAKEEIQRLYADAEKQVVTLNALNKELEAFSYSVSHDLRAPLRSIDGFSLAVLEQYHDRLDEKGKDWLARIRANSQRMARLIDDMLQLSRLTRGEMHVEPLDLSAIAGSICEALKQNEPDRAVSFDIQPGLVDDGDRHLIYAVLENLLGNAWKFTSKHPTAHIAFGRAETSSQGSPPVYFVQDDGAGFDMTYVDKLFGAFQRLHGMTEFGGNGIGLATVQRIIHRHGGKIRAESEIEKGATFYFTLNSGNAERIAG